MNERAPEPSGRYGFVHLFASCAIIFGGTGALRVLDAPLVLKFGGGVAIVAFTVLALSGDRRRAWAGLCGGMFVSAAAVLLWMLRLSA